MVANRSRSIKRPRRSRSEIERIKERIQRILGDDHPMTVRQLFYRLVSLGTIGKTEAEYKGTVVRLTVEMRRAGEIPFAWIADNTRWMRKPRSDSGIYGALRRTAQTYRRAIWDEQESYVEIWLEKDSLSGVLYPLTAEWDVPLMITRGFPSLSFLHEAAESIRGESKSTYLYYIGDHDPSGLDIPRVVEAGLREFAPEADITFHRVAVTPEQIASLGLPTRPTKTSDSRSRNFVGESVEVDAIEPATLRVIVEDCITQHIDAEALERLKTIEAAERRTLSNIAARSFP
jgi:hypothetical protein